MGPCPFVKFVNITSILNLKNTILAAQHHRSYKMSNALRREVLQGFKKLHRARMNVFEGDSYALTESRNKINEEYKKNKHVTELPSISELVQYSKAIENELLTSVIQAREVAPGKYEAKISQQTTKLDNIPYSDCERVAKKENKN